MTSVGASNDDKRLTTPRFAELPFLADTTERHAWDVWGRDDNLGSLNRIGPEQIQAASCLVRSGEVIPLTLPPDEPSPGIFPSRTPYEHNVRAHRGSE